MITCSLHSSCYWLSSCHTNLITSQIKNPIAYQTGSILKHSDSLQASLTHYSHLASHCSSHLWAGVPLSLPDGWVKTASATPYKMGPISERPTKGLLWESDEIMLWKPFETEVLYKHTSLSWWYLQDMPTQVQTRVLSEGMESNLTT